MPIKRNVNIGAVGIAGPFNLDPSIGPFNVAIQVFVPNGTNPAGVGAVTAAYSVEFTLDDLSNPDGSPNQNARWVTDPQFPVGSTATITGNYFAPISAVRVNVANIAGGNIELKMRQSDTIN